MKHPFWSSLFSLRRKRRRSPSARRRMERTVEVSPPWWLSLSPARVGLGVGTWVLLSFLLCIHLWPSRVSLRIGDIAPEEIVARRTVRYEDTEQTRQRREEAAAQVPPRYEMRPEALGAARESVRAAYETIERAAAGPYPIKAPLVAENIRRTLGISLPPPLVADLLELTPRARQAAREVSLQLVEDAMSRPVTDQPGDLERARREIGRSPALESIPLPQRAVVAAVARAALLPNQVYDEAGTRDLRARARAGVSTERLRLSAGEVVIRRGERVTQQHLDKFDALGLQNPRLDAPGVIVITVMVALLIGLVAVYLKLFHTALYRETSCLLLLAILSLFSVVGLKIGSTLLGLPFSGVHFGYLGIMCVASTGMAIALLLSPQVATLIVSLLSVASGLILNHELRFTLVTLGASLVGIVSVATLRNRGDLVRALVHLCAANVVLIVLVGYLEGETPRELATGTIWGVISGLFALALFWIGIALFEKPFGITTHLRLLELSDPATPLLQEFRMRVPGTYAHSLMVGSLAHAAAEAIGADGLLVRVAAYYHDIGKMNRPEFFVENQANAENIHDRLSPSMSALVLTSHVKDGLEMAQEVGLPPRVRDVIRQHHGTSLMKFFYHRATGGAGDPTLEAQFRYAGPKPQSKEAAILMLADSVEAASRCLDKPTPARVADFVARMVEDKRQDGQLDECDLTLRDLKKIQDIFVRTLSGIHHARVDYPDAAVERAPRRPALPTPPTASHPEEALMGALTVVAGGDKAEDETVKGHGDNDSDGGGTLSAAAGAGTRRRRKAAPPRA